MRWFNRCNSSGSCKTARPWSPGGHSPLTHKNRPMPQTFQIKYKSESDDRPGTSTALIPAAPQGARAMKRGHEDECALVVHSKPTTDQCALEVRNKSTVAAHCATAGGSKSLGGFAIAYKGAGATYQPSRSVTSKQGQPSISEPLPRRKRAPTLATPCSLTPPRGERVAEAVRRIETPPGEKRNQRHLQHEQQQQQPPLLQDPEEQALEEEEEEEADDDADDGDDEHGYDAELGDGRVLNGMPGGGGDVDDSVSDVGAEPSIFRRLITYQSGKITAYKSAKQLTPRHDAQRASHLTSLERARQLLQYCCLRFRRWYEHANGYDKISAVLMVCICVVCIQIGRDFVLSSLDSDSLPEPTLLTGHTTSASDFAATFGWRVDGPLQESLSTEPAPSLVGTVVGERRSSPPPPPPPSPVPLTSSGGVSSGAVLAASLNEMFVHGQPSNVVTETGIMVHQLDALDLGRVEAETNQPWQPCAVKGPSWCAKFGDRLSVSIINQKLPYVFSDHATGFIINPKLATIFCAFPFDGGSMERWCNLEQPLDECLPGCYDNSKGDVGCDSRGCFPPEQLKQMLRNHVDNHPFKKDCGQGNGCRYNEVRCVLKPPSPLFYPPK